MKKLLLAGLFLFAFPGFAMAQVTPIADVDTVEQSSCINISNNLRYRTRDASVNNEVSDLQDFLNMKGYLSSGPTGYFGLATFNAVKKFQKASGFAPTGYVGPLTRAKISALTCGGAVETPAPTVTSTPSAHATIIPATSPSLPAGCTSTIGYSSLTGKRCLVPVTPTTPAPKEIVIPSITVLSPNGGEAWTKGATQTIKWYDNTPTPVCLAGASCVKSESKYFDIRLVPSGSSSCGGAGMFCNPALPVPFTIVKNVSGSSYSWSVGKVLDTYDTVSDGAYTIQVCQGTTTCDESDSNFKIVSGGTTPAATVLSPNGGETIVIGNIYDIKFSVAQKGSAYLQLLKGDKFMGYIYDYIGSPYDIIGQQVYKWKVPSSIISGNDYKIRVMKPGSSGSVGENIIDDSDAPFSITTTTTTPYPTISSFSPTVATAGISTKIRVYGKNLNTVSRASLISGTKGDNSYSVEWSSISDTELEILTPAEMRLGDYAVNLCSSSDCATSSNLLWVQPATTTTPPTVEVIGTPVLALQYDLVGKESALVANYRVKITAGSQALSFPAYGNWTPLGFRFGTLEGKGAGATVTTSGSASIPADSSANYDISLKVNPNQIFAGTYYAELDTSTMSSSYVYSLDPKLGYSVGIPSKFVGNAKTNSVTVIGERAPYIIGVYDNRGLMVDTYMIEGDRFDSASNKVTINGVTKILSSNGNRQGGIIYFKLSDFNIAQSGNYSVQISTSEGASNVVNVNVTVASGLPDLTISKILVGVIENGQFVMRQVKNGERYALQTTVQNLGDTSVNSFNVYWDIQNSNSGERAYSLTLSPGQSQIVLLPFAEGEGIVAGNYFGKITADFQNIIKESKEDNNWMTVSFDVVPTVATPTIMVLSPNGGETMTVGKTYPLKWIIKNYPTEKGGLAYIFLRNVNTGAETSIVNAGLEINNESWINWTVPTSVAHGLYEIKINVISNAKDLIIKDASDASFSIVATTTAQPTLGVARSVTSPSGVLISGTQKLAEFILAAPLTEDVNITSITVENQAIDYGTNNIRLYDASVIQVGPTAMASVGGKAQFYGLNWIIPKGSSKTLSIYADIPSDAKGVNMGITAIGAIGSSGNTAIVSGLPVYGNTLLATNPQSSQLAGVIGAFAKTSSPTPAPTPKLEYEWTRNLEVGSSYADDVSALQMALTKEGIYTGEVTGGFYAQTYLAVKAFQTKYGIESTGFVGPTTRAKLNELY